MARVQFLTVLDGFPLTQQNIEDFIELFYRWPEDGSIFKFEIDGKNPKGILGECSYFEWGYRLHLWQKEIREAFEQGEHSPGGNTMPPRDIRVATGMVLLHELGHANQWPLFKGQGKFYGKLGGVDERGRVRMQSYFHRACEREARRFADEKLREACAYFGVPFHGTLQAPGMRAVVDQGTALQNALAQFQGPSDINLKDLKEALRGAGCLNPKAVADARSELAGRGVKVSS